MYIGKLIQSSDSVHMEMSPGDADIYHTRGFYKLGGTADITFVPIHGMGVFYFWENSGLKRYSRRRARLVHRPIASVHCKRDGLTKKER